MSADVSTNKNDASVGPLVSVIMNCYNGERYLREAIESVLNQNYPNWELVFFDNASTDGTAEVVREYSDLRIRYFRGEETIPLGAARNLAIAEVRGEYIAFLDSDDRWLPEKLALQLRCFDEQPDCGFVYGNYYIIRPDGRQHRIGLKGKQPHGEMFAECLYQYSINLQTVIIRASTLSVVNTLFDPDLEISEEYDLFMRMLCHVRAAYLDQPLAEYRIHDQMSSIRKTEMYPVEYRSILERFAQTIPDFEERYREELLNARAKLAYYQARAMMAKHRSAEARALLRAQSGQGIRYRILYFLTYLGVGGWNFAHRVVGRISI